jgi:hypothetical protein
MHRVVFGASAIGRLHRREGLAAGVSTYTPPPVTHDAVGVVNAVDDPPARPNTSGAIVQPTFAPTRSGVSAGLAGIF